MPIIALADVWGAVAVTSSPPVANRIQQRCMWPAYVIVFLVQHGTRYKPGPFGPPSLSPDGKLAVMVGDSPDGLLVDANSGKVVHDLRGHLDFSFASSWNPDGRTFATGNQDKTCRVWDIRNVAVLGGNIGAIRSICYTSDGKFMAMAETADFIHIFDVESGYIRKQEVDFFGEIAGISFSPDTESLFIGVHDRANSSLLQFNRRRFYSYLDSAL